MASLPAWAIELAAHSINRENAWLRSHLGSHDAHVQTYERLCAEYAERCGGPAERFWSSANLRRLDELAALLGVPCDTAPVRCSLCDDHGGCHHCGGRLRDPQAPGDQRCPECGGTDACTGCGRDGEGRDA